MINLLFWIVVALTYGIFAIWTAKLILEAIFVAMAKASTGPRPVRIEARRQSQLDRAA